MNLVCTLPSCQCQWTWKLSMLSTLTSAWGRFLFGSDKLTKLVLSIVVQADKRLYTFQDYTLVFTLFYGEHQNRMYSRMTENHHHWYDTATPPVVILSFYIFIMVPHSGSAARLSPPVSPSWVVRLKIACRCKLCVNHVTHFILPSACWERFQHWKG